MIKGSLLFVVGILIGFALAFLAFGFHIYSWKVVFQLQTLLAALVAFGAAAFAYKAAMAGVEFQARNKRLEMVEKYSASLVALHYACEWIILGSLPLVINRKVAREQIAILDKEIETIKKESRFCGPLIGRKAIRLSGEIARSMSYIKDNVKEDEDGSTIKLDYFYKASRDLTDRAKLMHSHVGNVLRNLYEERPERRQYLQTSKAKMRSFITWLHGCLPSKLRSRKGKI